MISSLNLPVRAFPSAAAFLDAVDPSGRGCVVIDVYLPGINGIQLQRKIRDHHPHLSTIMISADGAPEIAARAEVVGALAFLKKPVDDDRLVELVLKALHRKPNG